MMPYFLYLLQTIYRNICVTGKYQFKFDVFLFFGQDKQIAVNIILKREKRREYFDHIVSFRQS